MCLCSRRYPHPTLCRSYWFSPSSIDMDAEFFLVGVILGLAIHNGVILDVHFPLVVFKVPATADRRRPQCNPTQKLLCNVVVFDDLKDVAPDVHKGLLQVSCKCSKLLTQAAAASVSGARERGGRLLPVVRGGVGVLR